MRGRFRLIDSSQKIRVAQASLAAFALALAGGTGCGNRKPHASNSHVVYAIPDDFRLSMLRFQRRFEAGDIQGTLNSFDPLACVNFRALERSYLDFARRAHEIDWEWRIVDVKEFEGYRAFEVPWTLTFDDALHGHRVIRRGVTHFHWSHHIVPRIIGLEGDPLFASK